MTLTKSGEYSLPVLSKANDVGYETCCLGENITGTRDKTVLCLESYGARGSGSDTSVKRLDNLSFARKEYMSARAEYGEGGDDSWICNFHATAVIDKFGMHLRKHRYQILVL